MVVELRNQTDPDVGGAYTLKRWRASKRTAEGGIAELALVADNPDFGRILLRPQDGEVRVIAEFLEVVGDVRRPGRAVVPWPGPDGFDRP